MQQAKRGMTARTCVDDLSEIGVATLIAWFTMLYHPEEFNQKEKGFIEDAYLLLSHYVKLKLLQLFLVHYIHIYILYIYSIYKN